MPHLSKRPDGDRVTLADSQDPRIERRGDGPHARRENAEFSGGGVDLGWSWHPGSLLLFRPQGRSLGTSRGIRAVVESEVGGTRRVDAGPGADQSSG